jgi:hypothetical protein
MIIYGTGKWAQLIGAKLKDCGITPCYIGSDSTVATYDKNWPVSNVFKGSTVFIASSTQDHYQDLEYSLKLNPSKIFIEKGFANREEKEQARSIIGNVPTYILSQYRYSEVIKAVVNLQCPIISCRYIWNIDSGLISEWAYHILSIDNYLKKASNQLYIQEPGEYNIDQISSVSIQRTDKRSLLIELETDQHNIHIDLGKNNKISITNKQTDDIFNLDYEQEDCLGKQIKDVINSNTTILERL